MSRSCTLALSPADCTGHYAEFVPDAHYSQPRLAAIYDAVDGPRDDLDLYLDILGELGARSVLDVGCGTGSLAVLLAARGIEVVGVDPAAASLDVARTKPCADRVQWLLGDATTLPPLQLDAATMTGNAAQVLLTDEALNATLRGVHDALHHSGHFVFETRDPARAAWRQWDREHTYQRLDIPQVGIVETWTDVTEVCLPLVSFRTTFVFASDGAELMSDSTLRFRHTGEIEDALDAAGFTIRELRDAPDRPGREFVFVACADVQ